MTFRSITLSLGAFAALAASSPAWSQAPAASGAPSPSVQAPTDRAPSSAANQPAPPSAQETRPPIGAEAPTPPPAPIGPVLSLDDFIAQVLSVNPTVVQARLSAQRAKDIVGEAKGQDLPQIRIGANDTYSSIATSGASAASIPTIAPVVSTPVITDSASGSLSPGVSQPLSSSTISATSSGVGSSSSPTIAATITPVGSPITNSATTTTSGSSSASNGSSSGTGDASGQAAPRAEPAQTTGTTTGLTDSALKHNNYDATGSISQFVDVFGLAHASVAAARQSADFYDLDVRRVEDDESLTAKDVYFGVIKAQSDVATAQEQLANANATLDNAQINFNAGASPHFDVISAQAAAASAQANVISSQNELDIEKANINNLLARPIDTTVNVAPYPVVNVPPTTSTATVVALADAGRPEVQETAITQHIASELTRLAGEGMVPSLGITGAAVYEPNVSSISGAPTPSHYTETITASVSVPLWDGGVTASAVRAAKVNEEEQTSIRTQTLDDVSLEVRSALVNVIDAQSLAQADQSAVAADREALRIAGISYQAGAGTLLEVTNAEANLAVAEANLNSAVYQQQTAYAALLRAEGTR